jgi:RNA-directed DNA polymerase
MCCAFGKGHGMKRYKIHSLIDKIYSRKNLELAWEKVKENKGAAGVDGLSIQHFEQRRDQYIDLLQRRLREGSYRPRPVRRVEIPKPDGGTRKLGIPAVIDRVCQQAVVQRMEPIFEPSFVDCSFGYRPGRSPHMAMGRVWRSLMPICAGFSIPSIRKSSSI